MEYRHLGNSGLEVSAIGLGGNMFGLYVDEATTDAIFSRAIDLGINFFDNATTYADGASEELMGRVLEGRRHKVLIATKAGTRNGPPNGRGASRKYLTDRIETSLRRLRTDYLDLFQVHFPDPSTPAEETLSTLDRVVREGKVRYVGCSNYDAWRIAEAWWVAKQNHYAPFVSVQSEYNFLNRSLESDVIPVCEHYGIGLIPYYPLAGGFLSGKYRPGEPPPPDSRGAHSRFFAQWPTERNFAMVARLNDFAQKRGHTAIELAIAWLMSKPVISTIITGTSKPEQVESNVKAAEWKLGAEDLKELEAILE